LPTPCRRRYAEFASKKSHHVIGRPAQLWRRCHADPQLAAFGFPDGVAPRTGFAQNVDDERVSLPPEEH